MTITVATVFDNRKNRVALVCDAARPFVVLAPKGFVKRVVGRYASQDTARSVACKFNKRNGL